VLDRISAQAVAAEVSGFDSFWVSDHIVSPGPGASDPRDLEAYSLLGALATRTDSMRLGAVPVNESHRSPSMVGKIVAGIDVISHGRGVLSVGLGESGAEEDLAVAEALQVSRAMLEDDTPTFAGSVHAVKGAFNRPRPVQVGGVPLVVVVLSPISRSPGAIAAMADSADAVILEASVEAVSALIAETGATGSANGAASANSPSGPAVIGVGPRPLRWAASDPLEPLDVHSMLNSIQALFEAGVDGCLVPVEAHTRPEDISRIGEALAMFGSTRS
jgi:alkanesulfonate monooxygenase SsuD/methylene tetrahydromethanopterin reductase-like flavin-dependent oxidoreductase (luciferase family)